MTSNWENNLTRSLSNLSINEENDNKTQVHETLVLTNKIQQLEANLKELTQWNKEQVYDEINDNGQECISWDGLPGEWLTINPNLSKLVYAPEVLKKNKIFELITLLAQEKVFALSAVSYLQTNGYSIH